MTGPEAGRPVPPRPDPEDAPPPGTTIDVRLLLWITGITNAILVGLVAAGAGGHWLVVLLFLVDVGLLVVWSSIGHRFMLALGERIGERISRRRSGS
ncbi:MAG TPA: hypothetical protein VH989_11260 [Actinomycetota bacterium]